MNCVPCFEIDWYKNIRLQTHVFNATHVGSPLDFDVAIFTPVCAPGVFNQPIVLAIFSSITDSKDSMVCLCARKIKGRMILSYRYKGLMLYVYYILPRAPIVDA